jgi:hypothetical protein
MKDRRPIDARTKPTRISDGCESLFGEGSSIGTQCHADDRTSAQPGNAGDVLDMWSMSGPYGVMLGR